MVWQSDRGDVGKDGRGRGRARVAGVVRTQAKLRGCMRESSGTAIPQTDLSEGVDTLTTVYYIIQM